MFMLNSLTETVRIAFDIATKLLSDGLQLRSLCYTSHVPYLEKCWSSCQPAIPSGPSYDCGVCALLLAPPPASFASRAARMASLESATAPPVASPFPSHFLSGST